VGFEDAYELGAKLASGSYGTVYDGTHRASGDRVAVKVLPKKAGAPAPGRLPIDSLAQLQRLQREVDLMARVAPCQNVGTIHALHEDDAAAYVVLRFVDGGDLEGLLEARGQPLTEREAAVVAFELLKVVAACHAAGVVHGDVKPANIMLSGAASRAALGGVWKKPFVALSDFGLARACAAGDTVRGTRGTPVFMAPECFTGEYGQPADLFAVGVTL
jgi:calcium-dependent protein kinase